MLVQGIQPRDRGMLRPQGGRVISVASQESKTVHLMAEPTAVKRLLFDDETMNLRPNLVLVDRRGVGRIRD